MILISHRGNLSGINPKRENDPKYIQEALDKGYCVEVDIRFSPYTKKFIFAHELGGPSYEVDFCWLSERKDKLFIHCKDIASLQYFRESNYNFFYHSHEEYTVTSKGHILSHSKVMNNILDPEIDTEVNSTILMLPEKHGFGKEMVKYCYGVGSDMIGFYA